MTKEVNARGHFGSRHNVIVHFRFHDVVELELTGFNSQNTLAGISIKDVRGRQMEHIRIQADFCGHDESNVQFQSLSAEVVEAIPCDEHGRVVTGEGEPPSVKPPRSHGAP